MLGSLALTVTAAVVGWDLGQGCGKFEECPNGANENMGLCCPGCDGIHGLQIGGGAPDGVACSCPPECTTVKYVNGFSPSQPEYPSAENPICGKFAECDSGTNFGYCCPGCDSVGSITIGGGGVSCGCRGCPSRASMITTAASSATTPDQELVNLNQAVSDAEAALALALADAEAISNNITSSSSSSSSSNDTIAQLRKELQTAQAAANEYASTPLQPAKRNRAAVAGGVTAGLLVIVGLAGMAHYVVSTRKAESSRQHPSMPQALTAADAAAAAEAAASTAA